MVEFLYDKSKMPDNQMLAEVMGKSFNLWMKLKQQLENKYGILIKEWKFYGQKLGWTFKLLLKKRNLFFFKPCKNFFRLTFVFGDKAVNEILSSDFPDFIKTELKNARKYVEGRGLTLEVKNNKEIEIVLKLVEIKIRN